MGDAVRVDEPHVAATMGAGEESTAGGKGDSTDFLQGRLDRWLAVSSARGE